MRATIVSTLGLVVGAVGVAALGALGATGCDPALLADVAGLADGSVKGSVTFEMHLERFDTKTGQLEVLAPPPTKRNGFTVSSAAGKVLVVGGLNQEGNYVSAVDVYDTTTKAWRAGAPWARPHTAYTARVGDTVCYLGGATGKDARLSRDMDCYDAAADRWSARAPVPEDVGGGLWPAVADGKIYLLGSTRFDSADLITPLSIAYVYDPATDAWAKLPPPPSPRGGAAVVPYGDTLYVVAGFSKASDKNAPPESTLLTFTPKTGAWGTGKQMPPRGIFFGVDTLSTGPAAFFGAMPPALHRYDPAKDAWIAGTEPSRPFDAGVYTSLVHQGDLYLLVLVDKLKSRSTESSGKLWKYDAARDAWAIVGTRGADTRDALFGGVGVGDSLYFAGVFTFIELTKTTPTDAGG
ncbi:MAG TPA: hypothetical protein PLR99_01975 [Polyangiaceae bacterium]|nr:hypothetical protein [Polyangiaceae bacterium]